MVERWRVGVGFVVGAVVAALLSGCASMGDWDDGARAAAGPACASELSQDDQLTLSVVDQLVAEHRVYAALARLDTLSRGLPEVALKRGQILRRIGRDEEAEAEFRRVLDRCASGHAYHGLGLLRADAGDFPGAAGYLRSARRQLPVDPRVRNDLGFVLMVLGDLDDAHFELMSALDLSDGDRRPVHNLLLLYLSEGRIDAATALISRHGLTRPEVAEVQLRVEELAVLRGQRPGGVVEDGRGGTRHGLGADVGTVTGSDPAEDLALPPGLRRSAAQ